MNILGPDALVFGVDDVAACSQYLIDYGLTAVGGGRFEAADGTAIVIAHQSDASLPPGLGTASMLRQTVYGVADAATLTPSPPNWAATAKCAAAPTARWIAPTTWALRCASR